MNKKNLDRVTGIAYGNEIFWPRGRLFMTKRFKTKINRFTGYIVGIMVLLYMPFPLLNADICAETKGVPPVNCKIHEAPCTLLLSGRELILDIQPKPVMAMKDLTFRVTITGGQLSSHPYIDLGMPGMKMGPNRVVLKEAAQGVYEGIGVIVRCPSGRRTWSATVRFPDLGEAKFIFDVIY
jgi:hypothetical protein